MSRVAVVQMVSSPSVSNNLETVERLLSEAKQEQVELVVLPENFAFMGMMPGDKVNIAEKYGDGPIQDKLRLWAKKYDVWIIAGTLPLKTNDIRIRAASLVFSPIGDCVARYDKIHLFDVRISAEEVHQESATIERGDEVVVVDTPIGKIGLSVCYDLRFPELYQHLREKGADIFTIPSAFTAVTGAAHWETLLRARAIENLAYVLAPNQGGQHENGRKTYGHSLIVEPWGKIIGECSSGTGLVSAAIDLQRLRQLRKQFPTNEHHIL